MFGLFKKKKPAPPSISPFYDSLFGDVPLEHWKPTDGAAADGGAWATFDEVRAALGAKDKARAKQLLEQLLSDTDLESRQRLQAWCILRELGVQPPAAEAARVLGVVLEVAIDKGNDALAAYADYSAKFSSHSGKLIVWQSRDPQIDSFIDQLLHAGLRIAPKIGPWNEPRREPPTSGNVRLSVLTPSGLHTGEGSFNALTRDPLGGPIISTGARLMGALIGRAAG